MTVPYTFAGATSAIPLSQLDSNFATTITLGNTAIQLGNTVTTLNNMTLANVTISSGTVNITNVTVTTANVTTLNATTVLATTGNITTVNATTVVATTANVTTANITTANVTDETLSGSLTLSGGTANGVLYLNASKVATSGSALTFDGTTLVSGSSIRANSYMEIRSNTATLYWENAANTLYWSQALAGSDFAWNYYNGSSVSEQMRLTSAGLGIGTSSPGAKLDVVGTGKITNASGVTLTLDKASGASVQVNYNGNASGQMSATASGGLLFYTANGAGGSISSAATIDASGNLGLWVTPSAWGSAWKALQIGATTSLFGTTTQTWIGDNLYKNSSDANTYITSNAASAIRFNSGGMQWFTAASGTAGNAITFTQAMTLDANGIFMVGTTSSNPTAGIAFINNSTAPNIRMSHETGTASGTAFMEFNYNQSGCGSITQNGTGAVLYNTSSDYRLKTVLGAVSDAGARIDALEPVEYEWKANGERTRGFLAHKFQEVYPSSVTGEKDAVDAEGKPVYQAMQAGSSEVIADLVAEIKSLRQRVAQLEKGN